MQLKIVQLVLCNLPEDARNLISSFVSDFLVFDMSLSKAIELSSTGSLTLLDFVWLRSLRDAENSRWTVAKLLQTQDYYYKWEFSLALVQAIRRSDMGMVQWLLQHFSNCPVDAEVVEEAARGGHLWVLQLLESDSSHSGIEWGVNCLIEAAKERHWGLVHWLHERIGTPDPETYRYSKGVADFAFEQHNLEQLKWAVTSGFVILGYNFPEMYSDEERETYWEAVRFLLDQNLENRENFVEHVVGLAAKIGDQELAQRLVESFVIANEDVYEERLTVALEAAGRYGHIPVLQWLLTYLDERNFPHDPSSAMYEAAKYGKLNVVKWLIERYPADSTDVDLFRGLCSQMYATRTMCPNTVMDVAASHGHLEVLKYLHQVDASQRKKRKRAERETYPSTENCRRYTTKAMDVAASNGHLEVVKWLHARRNEGCTKFAMSEAAVNGHLDVVKWLHANRSEGCWENVIDSVAYYHYRVSLCCGNRTSSRETNKARLFMKHQVATIRWLNANRSARCTTKAMDCAAANGNLELMKWLHENTTTGCTNKAMDNAAAMGRLDILEWLHENYSVGCTTAAIDNAAARGDVKMLDWLYANCLAGCTAKALNKAVHTYDGEFGCRRGNLKAVQWLLGYYNDFFDILSTLKRAIVCKEAEIVCFLDSLRADRSVSVDELRVQLRGKTLYSLT